MKNKSNKPQLGLVMVMVWFAVNSGATGIMPPDLGLLGNILVYGGIPILSFLLVVAILVILIKWLRKKSFNQQQSNGELVARQARNASTNTLKSIKQNVIIRNLLVYLLPYLLILAYAIYATIDGHMKLRLFIVVEVLIVYSIIYFLPLMIFKYLKKIRRESGL